ncbi:MAG: hypothetical protein EBZ95_04835 [Chitinophagia bacterium]|nr:hypothetical protein [Chitinophagia bacterium]
MPITAAVIAGGATLGGALIGAGQASQSRDAANAARAQALAQYAGISVPDAEKMMLNLQQYQSAGTLTPQMEQLVTQGPTALEQISLDPKVREQQMAALQGIAGFASGSPTSADIAGFELSRQNAAGEAQAKSNQILQQMAQRGQAGSGAELIAQLQNAQSGASMLQQSQLQQAQAMQQAKLAALQQQAGMASNVRQQDYSQAANLAQAQDAIARFNAQNSQQVGAANTQAQNQAMAANLAAKQNLMNSNAQLLNQQQQYNKQLAQQNFKNQMDLAAGRSGQYGNIAAAQQQQAGQTAGMWGTIGQGLGTAIAGAYSAKKNKFDPQTGEPIE